jgi:hypothetical protein
MSDVGMESGSLLGGPGLANAAAGFSRTYLFWEYRVKLSDFIESSKFSLSAPSFD